MMHGFRGRKKTRVRVLTWVLAMTLTLGVFPLSSLTAMAEDGTEAGAFSFADSNVEYTLGESKDPAHEDVVANQTILGSGKEDGTITYQAGANGENWDEDSLLAVGLALDENTGALTVSDYEKLAVAIRSEEDDGGEMSVVITAVRAAFEDLEEASVSYTVNLKFADTPSDPYTLSGRKTDGSDWYSSEVTVTPASGYEIAQGVSDSFGSVTVFCDDGETDRYVYLREAATGAITDKIAVRENGANVRIDTAAPDGIGISYVTPVVSSLIGQMNYQFCNPNVTVRFTAKDENSGVASFVWTYEKLPGASDVNLSTGGKGSAGTLTAKRSSAGNYTASVILPAEEAKQLCGNLSVTVTDNAGNISVFKDENTLVVDTVAPVLTNADVTLSSPKNDGTDVNFVENGTRYLSGAAKVSLTITEANFYPEDARVKTTKDGAAYAMDALNWSKMGDTDAHTANFVLEEDGAYIVTAADTDKSGNVMVDSDGKTGYTSEKIVVDTTAPALESSYTAPCRTVGSASYYNTDVTAAFQITEANFFSDEVKVQLSKDDGPYTDVAVSWSATEKTDTYRGTYTIPASSDHSNDGNYRFRVTYTDRSGNQMEDYTSDILVMDTTTPVIRVSYANTNPANILTDTENHTRTYFDGTQTATVTITEHNFDAGDVDFRVIAADVNGEELGTRANVTGNALAFDAEGNALKKAEYPYCDFAWTDDGDVHTISITYPGDANYTFDVAYSDLATNAAADYPEDYFTVDTTPPENLTVAYSDSVLDTLLNSMAFAFFDRQMTVTIRAEDTVSPVNSFRYSYRVASGVSGVNSGLTDQVIDASAITYSDGGATATAGFTIPRSALGNGNQFNGTVDFVATDCANNESVSLQDTKRIVVDNISPVATVEYNAPVSRSDGISYYDGTVSGTVTITEANFYPDDVQVTATKNGGLYAVNVTWKDEGADVHAGTFQLSGDGDYVVTIAYRDKSGNRMTTYTSGQMTVDTQMESPVITINGADGNGKAYKDDVVLAVSFHDVNYDSYELTLARTRYYDIGADVAEEFIQPGIRVNEEGGSGEFDTFEKTADVDGIYTMALTVKDKAGHTAKTTCTFTVNRYGSVYVYGDELTDLIGDGGKYVQNVDSDLTITEYNADRLVEGSLNIDISCNGHALDEVDYRVSPRLNDRVTAGESGWYQYEYTISKENFAAEGIYRIAVSSKDAAGNMPETTNYADKDILFCVDKNAPEINSIVGLEDSIINAADVEVAYSVYDSIGLASVEVYVVDADGAIDWDAAEPVQTITGFDDLNHYEGTFHVSEKSAKEKSQAQAVRLVVTDLSGRVTDTANKDGDDAFAPAFAFHDTVTVSTNFFVRWFANKPIFTGSMVAMAAAAGGIVFLAAVRRRKNGEEETTRNKNSFV